MDRVKIRQCEEPYDCSTRVSRVFQVTSRKVPHAQEFRCIIDRFEKTGNVTPQKPPGQPKTPAEKMSAVKTVQDNSISPSTHMENPQGRSKIASL